jgi:cytochrome c2
MLGLSACQPVQPAPEIATATAGVQTVSSEATPAATAAPADVATPTATVTVEPATTPTTEPTVAPAAAPTADPALMAAGLAVYRAQYCGVCHELAAAGTTGTFGPSHNGLAATAAARIVSQGYSGSATTPAEYIYESIVTPERYIVPDYTMTSHRMPPYGHLPAADLEALVGFLSAQ